MEADKTLAQCEKAVFARDNAARKAIKDGAAVIEALGKGKHWSDWVVVANGLVTGVEIAKEAGKRGGKAYNRVMGEWLAKNPMYDEPNISKDDRAALINIFMTPGMAEKWHEISARMTPGERARVSSPQTVWLHIKPRSEKETFADDEVGDVDSPSQMAEAEKKIGEQADLIANAIPLGMNAEELDTHLKRIWATVEGREHLRMIRDKIDGLERTEKAALKRRDKEAKALADGGAVAH